MLPTLGAVPTYPRLRTRRSWPSFPPGAHAATSRDAVFLFADAGKHLGRHLPQRGRAGIYADWKGGGQVNYIAGLALEWWSRWQTVLARPYNPNAGIDCRALGIDYVVLSPQHRLAGRTPAFENSRYIAYAL